MQNNKDSNSNELINLTSKIVSAYLEHNSIEKDEIPALIQNIHNSLVGLTNSHSIISKGPLTPSVPIKSSITPDYLICLEDGKKLKLLKRYLRTKYNITPEQYRQKWGLPLDYPMVSPNYAKRRSSFAKEIGLGKKSIK